MALNGLNDPVLMQMLREALENGMKNTMSTGDSLQSSSSEPNSSSQGSNISEDISQESFDSENISTEDDDFGDFGSSEIEYSNSDEVGAQFSADYGVSQNDEDLFSDYDDSSSEDFSQTDSFDSSSDGSSFEGSSYAGNFDNSSSGAFENTQDRSTQTTDFSQDPVYKAQQDTINQLLEQQKIYSEQLAQALGTIQSLQSFMQTSEQQSFNNQAKKEVFSTKQPFESVISEPCTNTFMGQPFKYQRYEEEIRFDKRFERGMSDEDTARNYIDFVNKITQDIESKFGGWDRITSMAVVSNLLIINGVSYEPFLPEYYQEMLPFDVRNNLADGEFAWLFNFGMLRRMKNLSNLKFDSADFVYAKVRKDLAITFDFEPSTFFKVCKHLQNLQIGEHVISASAPNECNGVFHRASRSEEIYNTCLDFGWNKTKSGWNSIKTVFHDPDRSGLSKVWGITWRGVGTAAAGVGTAGVKASGLVAKLGKGVANFTTSLKNNLK